MDLVFSNIWPILAAAFVATASPGASTLAIAGVSMGSGRAVALFLAAGIVTGSVIWSSGAAFGLATLIKLNPWFFDLLRYLGAAYIFYLGYRCLKAALSAGGGQSLLFRDLQPSKAYFAGLRIHLTNPKVILFFASLFTMTGDLMSQPKKLLLVVAMLAVQSAFIFILYAFLFSSKPVVAIYQRLERGFNVAIGVLFCLAAAKILSSSL